MDNCIATIKALVYAIQPGKEAYSHETYEALARFHPDKDRPDPDALMSEIETFKLHLETTNAVVKNISAAAKIAEVQKSVSPLTNKAFRLALTAPVTVAKDERTFSKLKTVKNLCRSRTSDERLEELATSHANFETESASARMRKPCRAQSRKLYSFTDMIYFAPIPSMELRNL